jgi:outer membrane protein OmpA-like peptidoglycan-associated protein
MRPILFSIMVVFLFFGLTIADDTSGKLGIGARGGIISYSGDIQEVNLASYYDVNIDIWYHKYLGLNVTYGKGFLSASDNSGTRERYFKTWIWNYSFLLKLKPMPSSPLNPYMGLGYSIIDIDPKNRAGVRLPNRADEVYDKINYAIPIALGFSYFLGNHIAINLDGIYHYSGTDYIDDLKKGDLNDSWTSVAAGLTLYLGKPKDSDNDGIIDKKDRDPLHPEDRDGFEDYDGIPDPDNDGDGIIDLKDNAPLDPEDHDNYRDEDGRPDPDNDLDGVPDTKDACPGTDDDLNNKEDYDEFEDEDGCPDLDNDQDGIPDSLDNCPDEAETMNDFEDSDGCPDTKPELAVEQGQAMVLEGVNFASGSTQLTPESQTTLDKVVRTLESHSNIEIEIRGYTDNTGSYDTNIRLSKGRADSVRDYLIRNGISGDRISTKGFGPADPIAPNTTREGRAKNRRIEFLRTK